MQNDLISKKKQHQFYRRYKNLLYNVQKKKKRKTCSTLKLFAAFSKLTKEMSNH